MPGQLDEDHDRMEHMSVSSPKESRLSPRAVPAARKAVAHRTTSPRGLCRKLRRRPSPRLVSGVPSRNEGRARHGPRCRGPGGGRGSHEVPRRATRRPPRAHHHLGSGIFRRHGSDDAAAAAVRHLLRRVVGPVSSIFFLFRFQTRRTVKTTDVGPLVDFFVPPQKDQVVILELLSLSKINCTQ